ncbi:hypothetical protein TL16_g10893, partial [Triparma laevis f. inornata]
MVIMSTATRAAVYKVETGEIVRRVSCVDEVKEVKWDSEGAPLPDSNEVAGLILFVIPSRSQIHLVSLLHPTYSARISLGLKGVSTAHFLPGSGVGTVGELGGVSVWDLEGGEGREETGGKALATWWGQGEESVAILSRTSSIDSICILHPTPTHYAITSTFPIDTVEAVNLSLTPSPVSPSSFQVVVADTHLANFFFIYSTGGQLYKKISICDPTGLGARMHSVSADGDYVAVGTFGRKIHLISTLSNSIVTTYEHNANLNKINPNHVHNNDNDRSVNHYTEYVGGIALPHDVDSEGMDALSLKFQRGSRDIRAKSRDLENGETTFECSDSSTKLPESQVPIDWAKIDPKPKVGVSLAKFGPPDTGLIATKDEKMCNVLWIWSIGDGLIATVTFVNVIKSYAWDNKSIVVVTGGSKVYRWNEEQVRN